MWETLFTKKQEGADLPDAGMDQPKFPDADPVPSAPAFSIAVTPKCAQFSKLYKLANPEKSQSVILLTSSAPNREALAADADKIRAQLEFFANARMQRLARLQESRSARNLDEDVFVYITEDQMLAFFLLVPPIGNGKTLSGSKILQILIDHGVSYGLDFHFIYTLPERENRYFRFYLGASGTMPEDGRDGYIVELYQRELYASLEQTELSHVDYAQLSLSKKIQKNGVICEIVPPTAGRSGITVKRNLLLPPPRDGRPAAIPMGRNTCLSEDGRYLIAQKDGNVAYAGNSFQVKPILEIRHGIEPGDQQDIKFLGDIHIHGDVCPGVSIRATGSVQIDGVAQDCTIEAGESVIVLDGIQGQYSTTIRAHKSVYAGYLEHCTVYARESVQANCIVDCHVYCNGPVTARTGLGAIVSGSIQSAKGVSSKAIGSKAAVRTEIIIGGCPYDAFDREEISAELENINKNIRRLAECPETPETKTALSKLRLNQYVVQMKLNKLEKEAQSQRLPLDVKDACPLRCSRIHPGVCITIGNQSIEMDTEKTDCAISINAEGALCYVESR